ncbi:nitrogenase-associated protein [Oscillatoria sp. FACHB-1407]|uniref:ArsC/Spx/MgsR family protein n=1 Tax=Oscillatoria sp. FACHB-1407 TaxID=2692847 RepID=UPI001683DF54|nr:ArsC/Spx/MgsR family protein [Oscillatoria sp. FACHB-1407]MBD2459908.1 nitrogenase-associated protein [Oscillatoria sp. FACHB-1407]
MTTVIFYEKPGCVNNTKQKTLLLLAGHTLEIHNLLIEPWTCDRLRCFFGERPVAEWFNRTAPQIKSGEIVPEQLDAETALTLMIQNPILIRRPLMQVGDRYTVGFNAEQVDQWIGLSAVYTLKHVSHQHLIQQDLETCPRTLSEHHSASCSHS